MTTIAKLFMHDGDQAVCLPDDCRFEGSEVRISREGDKVILEPLVRRPFDAAAWQAGLDQYRDIPFMEDGRDQGTIVDNNGAADMD